jgi:type II secretory pathway pseudopilin PulG
MLEVMCALGIAGIISSAATIATISIYRSAIQLEQQSFAHEEAKMIVDALTTAVLQVGGGKIRPWNAVDTGCWVNASTPTGDCNTRGGTHLTFIDADLVTADACSIASVTPATGNPTKVNVTPYADGTCCVSPTSGYPAAGIDVVLAPSNSTGGGWEAKRCVPLTGSGAANCGCTLTDLTGVGAAVMPAVSGVTRTWAGGTLAVGQSIRYELFPAGSQVLTERRDFDGDGSVERRTVSDRVFDLRVQFGFDAVPEDGVLDQVSGSAAWYPYLDASTLPANPRVPATMRMARVGIVVGATVPPGTGNLQTTLFGTTVTDPTDTTTPKKNKTFLRPAESAVTMRNLLVFY